MHRGSINLQVLGDASWWHWALTVPLLTSHLVGLPGALGIAVALSVIACGYFLAQLRQLRPYPVQVRIAYSGLLLIGLLPGMSWVHWIQCLGTTSMVMIGYCPLMRLLSLLPLNRSEPLTWNSAWQTFLGEPYVGGLLQWSTETPALLSCSLQNPLVQRGCCSLREDHRLQKASFHAQTH